MVTAHAPNKVSKLIFHLFLFSILHRRCCFTQIVLFLVLYGAMSRFDHTSISMAFLLRQFSYRFKLFCYRG